MDIKEEKIKEIEREATGWVSNVLLKDYIKTIIEQYKENTNDMIEARKLVDQIAMFSDGEINGVEFKMLDIEDETIEVINKLTEIIIYYYIKGYKDND